MKKGHRPNGRRPLFDTVFIVYKNQFKSQEVIHS
jgi:hypothetical protein